MAGSGSVLDVGAAAWTGPDQEEKESLMLIELSLINLLIVMVVGFLFGVGFHVAGWILGWTPRRSS